VGQTGSGYNQFPAYSAYVLDHTCSNRYVNAGSGCSGDGTQYVNYAFQEVPEPTSLVVLGAGLVGLSRVKRRSTP
jgi:hypothetical protein